MFSNFFESLESRSMLSVTVPVAAQPAIAGSAITAPLQITPHAAKAPTATLAAKSITKAVSSYTFTVTYKSATKINAATIATGNVTVTGPGGYKYVAKLVSIAPKTNATSIVATYKIAPKTGTTFTSAGNGTYTVTLAAKSVKDIKKVTNAKAVTLGTFKANIAATVPTGVIPSLVGSYNGSLKIPAIGHNQNLAMTISSQNSTGGFTGTMVSDGLVQLSVSGTVSANGSFTFKFATPSGTSHPAGAITGTGSGTGAGTNSLAVNITALSSGMSAPGTISVTKV